MTCWSPADIRFSRWMWIASVRALPQLQLLPFMHLNKGGIALAMKRNLGPAESTTSRVCCSVAGRFSSSITRVTRPAGSLMPYHSGDYPIFCFGCTFGALCFSLQLPEAPDVSMFQLWAIHQKKLKWSVLCVVALCCLSRCVSPPSSMLIINDQEYWQSFPLSSAFVRCVFIIWVSSTVGEWWQKTSFNTKCKKENSNYMTVYHTGSQTANCGKLAALTDFSKIFKVQSYSHRKLQIRSHKQLPQKAITIQRNM